MHITNRLGIADALHKHGAGRRKTWAHDRLATLGSSENGRCARQVTFEKLEVPPDPGYQPTWGAALRGDLLEENFWVPALKAAFGINLLYAGQDQVTRVDGYLSATPDGLLTNLPTDCLSHLGIPDIETPELLVECKSIDPRMSLRHAKSEHIFQVQVALGVMRATTAHRPTWALITYINASFLNDITEFAIRFDAAIYAAAGDRARRILGAHDPGELPPEGKIAGGSECRYCAWAEQCIGVSINSIPNVAAGNLGNNAIAELKALRDKERELADASEIHEHRHAAAAEAIKQFLREHDIRGYRGDGWSVQWGPIGGRTILDTKAVTAAGIDLSPFQREGKAGERLVVK
jgi:hypothetical protein